MSSLEETYNDTVNTISNGIKKNIYDIVAGIIIIAILAASLHVFGLTDLSDPDQLPILLMDWLPYLAAAVLLNTDLYQKGVFVGKSVKTYLSTSNAYNKTVNELSGKQLDVLPEFCAEYNDKALIRVQREMLKAEGISYEYFDTELRKLSEEDLFKRYPKRLAKLILRVKYVKVKGVNVNILLSSFDVKDSTDLGKTEMALSNSHTIWSTLRYIFTTLLMSFIIINDLSQWGWSILIVVVFKIAFLVSGTLMSYFKGYNNITVNLVAHIARKTDILKEFDEWCSIKGIIVKDSDDGENTEK